MQILKRFFSIAAVLAVSTSVYAHGPQLQITNEGGKIITREIFQDAPYDELTAAKSVYVLPLLPTGGVYFTQPNVSELSPGFFEFVSGPGVAYGLGNTFNSGFQFKLSFMDGLKLWNGSSFVDPGTEQLQAYRGSASAPSTTATTSDSGPFSTLTFGTISATYNADSHGSAGFRLLGDGVNPASSSQDGVYLLSLQLSSTDPSLTASDPYYFLLYKNVGVDAALTAAASLGFGEASIQNVPEASSISLVATAAAVGGFFWRRSRRRAW